MGHEMITALAAGEYLLVYPCVGVKTWRWSERTRLSGDKDPLIEFKLKDEENWRNGYLESETNEVRGVQSSPRGRLTMVNQRLEYHPTSGKPRVLNATEVFTLDSSAAGVPMIDLLNTDWAYSPDELEKEDLDRQDKEVETNHPHVVWRILGVTAARWDVALGTAWDWFTRIVCLWIVFRPCLTGLKTRIVNEMKTRTDVWRNRDEPPERRKRYRTASEDIESDAEVEESARKVEGGAKKKNGKDMG